MATNNSNAAVTELTIPKGNNNKARRQTVQTSVSNQVPITQMIHVKASQSNSRMSEISDSIGASVPPTIYQNTTKTKRTHMQSVNNPDLLD